MSLSWLIVLLAMSGQARSDRVRYCNKIFELEDRSDESLARCRWLEREGGGLDSSQVRLCDGGLECEGECVPWQDWCSPSQGSSSLWRCGALLSSPLLCSNRTFWSGLPCPASSHRCSHWWPGQCSEAGQCRDSGNTSGSCILQGDTLVRITPSMFQCRASHHNTTVCAVRCDRRLDGCLEDEDEADCVASSHSLTLVLALIPALLLTLLTIETVVRAVTTATIEKQNLDQGGQSGPLVGEREEDSELAQHLAEFSRIILDQNNWDLGLRDDSNILSPSYHEGGFDVEKLDKVKQLYRSIRNTKKSYSPLQYITYTVQMDDRLKDHQISSALKHHTHCLIYNILEREYMETQGHSRPTDVDISIMQQLTTRHARDFYGQIFPYFDPIGSLKRSLGVGKIIDKMNAFISRIPHGPDIKYALIVTLSVLGWYIDFIKDILIAIDLSFLYKSLWDFKSQIVLILWVTVFLSQTITGIYISYRFWAKPSQIFGNGLNGFSFRYKMLARLAFILLAPVSPAILIYVNKKAERELKKNEKKLMLYDETNIIERLHLFEERHQMLKEKDELEGFLMISYKIDNVLENTPQLLVQLLIVLMSGTCLLHLPEVTGIQAVFDDRISDNFLSSAFFYLSIGWSLQSICIGHISTYLMKKKNNLPDVGKVLAFLLYFLGCTARIVAIVFFFTPALGLFNLMLPYSMDQRIKYSPSVEDQIGRERLEDMADIGWYYLLSVRPDNCLFVFSLLPLVHLIMMFALRGKITTLHSVN